MSRRLNVVGPRMMDANFCCCVNFVFFFASQYLYVLNTFSCFVFLSMYFLFNFFSLFLDVFLFFYIIIYFISPLFIYNFQV